VSTLAARVMPVGPMIREAFPSYGAAIKNKSYRQHPIGQQAARYLRSIRWRDYADTTLLAYEETFAKLAIDHDDFDGLNGFCNPAGVEYLRDFLDRHWGGCLPNTRKRHLSALKSLCEWATDAGVMDWNAAASIKPPRNRSGGVERVAYGVKTLHLLVTRQPSMRDQCALQLLCRMGLRKNELRLLTLGDIDLVRNLLVVHGKGGKVAVMPLAIKSLQEDLRLYLQERAPYNVAEHLLYPRSHRLQPMDPASVHRWFKRCLETAGLPATIKAHEMRHSAADNLWRSDGDIVKAQQLLRHASVATTQAYLHPTREDLAQALERLDESWGA